MLNLYTPIEKLPRVGPRFLTRLKKLGIKTIRDLLWHFPARYEDYSRLLPISDISGAGQTVSITGEISDIEMTRSWRRHMAIINAVINDGSGSIRAVWFNQPYLIDSLQRGTPVSLSGKVALDKKGLYLSSPSYEKIPSHNFQTPNKSQFSNSKNTKLLTTNYSLPTTLTHTGRLIPVYPETEGITSKYLRFLIKPLLANIGSLPDPLPQELLDKYNLPKLSDALQNIHFPENLEQTKPAAKRFAFEELLLFQLRALRDHRHLQALKAPAIKFNKELVAGFVKSLPFELTNDQRKAAFEILQDLERPFPMNRLLNGDVGSGKTVVALIAAYQAVNAGYQTVIMAPTEILARQHYQTITKLLSGISNFQFPISNEIANSKFQTKIGLITGSESRQWPVDETETEKISKKLMHKKIASGEISIIIGTHAVIQKDVKFAKLGLTIIDEQHRFGVDQRMKLVKNSSHLLSMTATPIPRTLALTVYGDLDVSLIKEKPKGRQNIITKVVPHSKRENAHKFIDSQIGQGRQVFVICPRIEASSFDSSFQLSALSSQLKIESRKQQTALTWAEVKAVTEEYEKLARKIFPHRQVIMLHGRMKPKEKEEIMKKFKDGHYDILVSTSVVEVGVDVPNATIMMIESAERFGLAQLHQFRGRVGRGTHQSHCFLFTTSADIPAGQRLRALEKTDDGFQLAEMDLKIRGPGEFTGTQQSGIPDIAMASLTDLELIKSARLEARLILKNDPALKSHIPLASRLDEMQRLVHFE